MVTNPHADLIARLNQKLSEAPMTTADKPLGGLTVIFSPYMGAVPLLSGGCVYVLDKGHLLWWIERSEEESR